MVERSWFQANSPEFRLRGEKIKVLGCPIEFYWTLKNLLPTAKNRIVISSLYLGTGESEKQLVDAVDRAITLSDGELKVQILLDYTRGSRGKKNSRTMLLPLFDRTKNLEVALYHTPDLRGISKKLLPERWNEVIGLAHMKIYIIDNNVIISGANLSHDYFTNRQDRYIIIEDSIVADFFQSLVATVSTFSIQLNSDNTESLHKDWKIHPFLGDYKAFKAEVKRRVDELIDVWKRENLFSEGSNVTTNLLRNLGVRQPQNSSADADSWVYPLVQMGPYNITHDETATNSLFRSAPLSSRILLATGYFNLTPQYEDVICNQSKAEFNILTASPRANGFFNGKGISGYIPKLYLYLANLFRMKVKVAGQRRRICIHEYEYRDWTFHGKGLWYYPPSSHLPTTTFIGSPNFGCRSVYRDLEAQVAVVTSNTTLKKNLFKEQERLFQHSSLLQEYYLFRPERRIPLWVRLFSKVFRSFF
ncbi:CDP-diacylglycerol--glycerol-3-phosphate 3-phosphatidyltransferase [Chamberlinius hualienensis]